jgi:hypothetical protein
VVTFTSWPLYSRGKSPRYSFYRRLCGHKGRSGRYAAEKIYFPYRESNPGHTARSQSLCLLSYPGSSKKTKEYDLKVCDDGTLVQILRFRTLSIVYRQRLAPSIGPNWVGLTWRRTKTESSLRNVVFWNKKMTTFSIKTKRWIMSKNVIFVWRQRKSKRQLWVWLKRKVKNKKGSRWEQAWTGKESILAPWVWEQCNFRVHGARVSGFIAILRCNWCLNQVIRLERPNKGRQCHGATCWFNRFINSLWFIASDLYCNHYVTSTHRSPPFPSTRVYNKRLCTHTRIESI